MNSRSQIARITLVFAILTALFIPSRVFAAPAPFDWGSFDSGGSTTYGVYDMNNVTILETGDLAQLIWAGPDGIIDPPNCDGTTAGDDQVLDRSSVQNGAPLPPTLRNRGYISSKTYTFDTESPQSGGVVYIRAWNNSNAASATAYGNSSTTTLSGFATYNALRWFTGMTDCVPLVVTLASFTVSNEPGMLVVAWETTSEVNNQGFNLYRNTDPTPPDGEPLASIPSQAPGSTLGFAYEWIDSNVVFGQTYYYWLEDVDLNGTTTLHGPVSATVETPTAVTLNQLRISNQPTEVWPGWVDTLVKALQELLAPVFFR